MRAIRIVLLAVVIFVLQFKVVPSIGLLGAAPDLVTVLLVALALERGTVGAVVIGFALGFLQDLGNASYLGVYALSKSLVAYGVSRFGAGFLPESILFKGVLIFAASLFNEAVVLVVTAGFDVPAMIVSFIRYSIPASLYTAVVGVVVFAVVDAVTGRVVGARAGR
ncbi:MAG TPA: rod shape-determining protein MreD [Candidatus Eisenbacteria bacterium]|uniref:Rod shape-determining protein MreD n=1 Tax=Eiseniibacteriota bacterium TaxID=2212470 RepID=A0A7V2AW16_UNCEI|nr:rod shape-determining protein MreD [Candidatus Eisenbacteria bacterium]